MLSDVNIRIAPALMKNLRATIVKNAVINIVRGGANTLAALALLHYLTHTLDAQRFSAWSLMLQIAAYASFLDFGLQTAIARFVAQAIELEQNDRRDRVVESAFAFLLLAGALAFVVIGCVIAAAAHLFHGIPAALLSEFQIATLILALGAALALPLSAFSGALYGMHRNEFPAFAVGGGRVAGVLLVILFSHRTHSLITLALCVAGAALAGALVQVPMATHHLPSLRHIRLRVDRVLGAELLRFCAALTMWSLSMLIVSGLDLLIVGHFQFSAVGFYAVGAAAITLIAGFNSSVLGAFLTPQAALHARGEISRLSAALRKTSFYNSCFNIFLALSAVIAGHALLRLWVGETYAARALPVLIILAIAQAVRLAGAPFCMMLIATGEQRRGIASGLFEAAVNLTASIVLAYRIGYTGVAWGTLIGAVAGIAALIAYTAPRAQAVPFTPWQVLDTGLLRPLLCLLPMLLFTLAHSLHALPHATLWGAASLLASACLMYSMSEHTEES